jgi:hypothetical protein
LEIKIFYHSKDEKKQIQQKIQNLVIPNSKLNFFNLSNRVAKAQVLICSRAKCLKLFNVNDPITQDKIGDLIIQ